jgi:hypothetical protein
MARDRTSAEFSPTPPVNTSASRPSMAAAIDAGAGVFGRY